VLQVMQLRREVLTGLRAVGELLAFEGVTEEQLEEQREELEGSMRELVAAAAGALQQWHESSVKVQPLLADMRQLLDPDRLRGVPTRSLAGGDLLEEVTGSNVWQRLDALAKATHSRPHPHRELLVHVRKGKPTVKAIERGGRYKPGEAAKSTGQNAEEGLA